MFINCLPKGKASDDAETRKAATSSLSRIIKTLGVKEIGIDYVSQAIEVFYKALEDYAIDRRGDVGSWTREEAMPALLQITDLIIEQ